MHSGVWFAFAVITGPALSASLPRARQSDESLNTSPLKLIFPGNVSTAPMENLKLPTLINAGQHPSNYSSLYDLPFEDDLTAPEDAVPRCDGVTYGVNLNRTSCFHAWRAIGLESAREIWGLRDDPNIRHKLPARWSSGKSAFRDFRKHL